MRCPISFNVAVPSRISPQLMSMSSLRRLYMGVLVASLTEGTGFAPNMEPRPVVNMIILAPPAIWPVAEHGSKPGVSMNTNPFCVTGSA